MSNLAISTVIITWMYLYRFAIVITTQKSKRHKPLKPNSYFSCTQSSTTFRQSTPMVGDLFRCLYVRPRFTCRFSGNRVLLFFVSCLMTSNNSDTNVTLRLSTHKRHYFRDTLAISGQVTTDRQLPTSSRAGRRDGSDGTVRSHKIGDTLDFSIGCNR